ncbi:MAG: DUF3168 domain-containing protein [Henriciella sp.]|nr:DUF3168 domain-containing protein [Henriciella sp.]
MDLQQDVVDCVIATLSGNAPLAALFPGGATRIEDISPSVDLHELDRWPFIAISESEEYDADGELPSDQCTDRRETWVFLDIWDKADSKHRVRQITSAVVKAMNAPESMARHSFSLEFRYRRSLRDPDPRVHRERLNFRFVTQPK